MSCAIHRIGVYIDATLTTLIAELRLTPTQAFGHGNIYEALNATECRSQNSGTGKVLEYKLTELLEDDNFQCNRETSDFLNLALTRYKVRKLKSCYIKFG